jgi:predicted DNA-binding transcriptional regulator AlpA
MEPLMDIRDVAATLNVSVKTMYNWHARGQGPRGVKLGKGIRYRGEDVRRYIDSAFSSYDAWRDNGAWSLYHSPVAGEAGVPFHYLPVRPTSLSKALQLVVQQGTSCRTDRYLPASGSLDGNSS